MQYLLMIVSDEAAWTSLPAEAQRRVMEQHEVLERDLRAQNKFRYCGGLGPAADGKTLRSDGAGEILITDGPYLETKEVLGGYYVIEADSLDEAVAWTKRMPAAVDVTIEVREIEHGQQVDVPPEFDAQGHKYLCVIAGDETWRDHPPDDPDAPLLRQMQVQAELLEQHRYYGGGGLGPSCAARTLKRNGRNGWTVTDGPFAETNEVVGGFYIIRADAIEHVVERAKLMTTSHPMSIEIRQVTH